MNHTASPAETADKHRAWQWERFAARDQTCDGQFIVGVQTTGIYCLPSCPARKPLPENVRFFAGEADAQAFGLRACRKCRPDYFYRNFDPDADAIARLAQQICGDPAPFGTIADLTKASGIGATKLHGLFRRHFHQTPAQFVTTARIRAACGLLQAGDTKAINAAFAVGYDSVSAFHDNFRSETGLTPGEYQKLRTGEPAGFILVLPADYRWKWTRNILCRDAQSLTERATENNGIAKALEVENQRVVLCMEPGASGDTVLCRVNADTPIAPRVRYGVHAVAVRLLGLVSHADGLQKMAEKDAICAQLIAGRHGLRIPQTADVWEGVAWAIIGQQINLPFAFTLRRVVTQLCQGDAASSSGLVPFPDAASVARLNYDDLTTRQFSRRKAEYLIDTARRVAVDKTLDLAAIADAPFEAAEKTLLAVRGIGPWSAHYILMRACGFEDCVPLGDTGLTAGLRKLFGLDRNPTVPEAAALMERFAPFRSLATHHLWLSLSSDEVV